MGGFADSEIPLLLMLFYLFHEVEAGLHPISGLKRFGVIYVEDIVRWGVWLGRHIC